MYDVANGAYHRLWSTDPAYTGGLSRWEHHQYQAMLRAGADGAVTERSRLRAKAKELKDADQNVPAMAFRARANIMALIESEEIRRASGAHGRKPGFGMLPELHTLTGVGGEGRADVPAMPPQPANKARPTPQGYTAPERPDDYGTASIPREGAPGMDPQAASADLPDSPGGQPAPGTPPGKAEGGRQRSRWDFDDDDLGDRDDHLDGDDDDQADADTV